MLTYKLYEYRYTFKGNFKHAANCIKAALDMKGYREVYVPDEKVDLHVYNHTARDLEPHMPENSIIFKPTAPTSKHFQICDLGYANSSRITFEKPPYKGFTWTKNIDWAYIEKMIEDRTNKWDDSILVKWEKAKKIPKNHILVIGQIPEDETVNGFGFGDHWKKMCMIIDKLKDENVVIKLHPRIRKASHIIRDIHKQIEKWEEAGHTVLIGFKSMHDVLPKTRVAILDNSTAGIECMMHDVPIISYGYPDYHWITKDLRILTELRGYIKDLSWFSKEDSRCFLLWYIYSYLCNDELSTYNRLGELLDANV